ncbi:MAG TPA: Do family serine endopeptidase [Stellaceae bacterium]|nr:Do family serine endopeptidase [Stellaceae bacterium]
MSRLPGRGPVFAAALLLAAGVPAMRFAVAQSPAPANAVPPQPAPPPQAPAPVQAPPPAAPAAPAPTTSAAPAPPTAPAAATSATPGSPPEKPFADVFSTLASRLVGVVVNISTTQAVQPAKTAQEAGPASPGSSLDDLFRDFFGDKGAPGQPASRVASLGSGFIIDPSGLIVTNAHVIANADQITVTLSDDTSLQAQVIGRDSVTDLAVLKVDTKTPLPAATWGDSSKAKVGDWVLAIGNPFGLGGTVTAGIISATARDIHSGPYDDYLQTDASINRGNSGGPMFNLQGEVIGINTAIYSPTGGSIGIGFAVPTALAQPIIDQLRTTGKVERGWIGARIQPVTDDIAESLGLDKARGALIASIDPASPATQGGLKPGDVVLTYDGKPVDRSRQLPRLVADSAPNKPVKLTIWRDGKEAEVTLTVVAYDPSRPQPQPQAPPEQPKPPPAIEALGLKIARLTPEWRKYFGLSEAARGVVVVEVPQNSPGSAQGLRAGDLMTAAGAAPIASPEEIQQHVAAAKKAGHKNILVRVEREGNFRFIALPIEES